MNKNIIFRQIFIIFAILIISIIANTIFSTIRESKYASTSLNEELNYNLDTSYSIILDEMEHYKMVTGILKEKNRKFYKFLLYDNFKPIEIMLKNFSNLYNLDEISFFNESNEIKASSSKSPKYNFAKILEEGISNTLGFYHFDIKNNESNKIETKIGILSIFKIYYEIGDDAGFIVFFKSLNKDKKIAKNLKDIGKFDATIFDNLNNPILTTFKDKPEYIKNSIKSGNEKYLIKEKAIFNIKKQKIGKIVVGINEKLMFETRKRLIIDNLLPFFATLIVSLLLFFLLKIKVFNRIQELVKVLHQVTEQKENLSVRLDFFKKNKEQHKYDEIENMGIFFNLMMEKLEKMYSLLKLNKDILEVQTDELEAAHERALEASRAKSIFLANMSHEIRTPMNAILGYSQILLKDKALSAFQNKAINTINYSGTNLLKLINDILDLSKIEAGHISLNESVFDLGKMAENITDLFFVRCLENHISWKYEGPSSGKIFVSGDEGKLRQILINLVGNALKFTNEGGVFLRIIHTDSFFTFSVSDTGTGISPDAVSKIFNPFHQTDSGIKKGGTGLGLAISKNYVQLMGGELKVESIIKEGSEFYFKIPLTISKKPDLTEIINQKSVKSLHPEYNVKIIIADSNKESREFLSTFLTELGFKIYFAINGKDCINLIRKKRPDIIFISIRMPVMNGIDTIKRIRKFWTSKSLKCVALTASTYTKEKENYSKIGFNKTILKPIKFDICLDVIKELLNIKYIYEEDITNNKVQKKLQTTNHIETDVIISKQLPENIFKELHSAAASYEVTGIKKALSALNKADEVYKPFINKINSLLEKYDMDGIVELLDNYVKRQ